MCTSRSCTSNRRHQFRHALCLRIRYARLATIMIRQRTRDLCGSQSTLLEFAHLIRCTIGAIRKITTSPALELTATRVATVRLVLGVRTPEHNHLTLFAAHAVRIVRRIATIHDHIVFHSRTIDPMTLQRRITSPALLLPQIVHVQIRTADQLRLLAGC